MQDIDFDEIDRAVTSTMSSPNAAPAVDETADARVPVTVTRTSTPVAPRPTSGRFMDVVHPSSDMKPAERAMPQPEAATSEPETPAEATWPDPLDFHGFKDEEPQEAAKEETPSDERLLPESPFLSDAKVEKRPLGIFSVEEPAPVPVLEQALDDERIETETEPEAETTVEEVVSVEDSFETTPLEGASVAPAEEEISNVPTSITQQYQEQPAADHPSGAIYDTESYHAPLAHAPKKSGILVVLWIIGLIVLGGGIGALAYFFVLPNL